MQPERSPPRLPVFLSFFDVTLFLLFGFPFEYLILHSAVLLLGYRSLGKCASVEILQPQPFPYYLPTYTILLIHLL